MKTSEQGINLIKEFEGLYLNAYRCPAGIPTIGWGCTEGIRMGMTITREQAELMLRQELAKFENAVNRLVKVELSQSEFDALVSFAYNLGEGALAQSTLLKKLNFGDKVGAANEFPRWNKAVNSRTGEKQVLPGLTRRREVERKMFLLQGVTPPSQQGLVHVTATPGTFIKRYCRQSSELGEDDKKWLPFGSAIEVDNHREISKHYQVAADGDWWDGWWIFASHCQIEPIAPTAETPEDVPQEATDFRSRIVRYMQAQGYRLFTEEGQLNIVAIEGVDPDGDLNDDRPNYFNDLLVVLNHKLEFVDSFICTTEPGRYYTDRPLNRNGVARIKFGQYSAWQTGLHNGKYEALVQTGGPVTVVRDRNRNYIRDSGDVEDTGYFGINVHHGGNSSLSDIGRYSAGCTVIASIAQFREFLQLVKSDVRYRKDFVFTISFLPGDRL